MGYGTVGPIPDEWLPPYIISADGTRGTRTKFADTSVALDDTDKTVVTGTETDEDFSAQVIGKNIPIFVGGQALMGCRIIEGPFLTTVDDAGFCDMIVSPAVTATPSATRSLTSIRLNGTESFTSGDGGATWTPVGDVFDDVVINVLYGTEEQTPFTSSIVRYGTRAVPYRSHICIEIKNIPLSEFANEIPFVSVHVHEADYLTRNDALAKLAEYARFDSSEYEIEVSGQDVFWIVAKQSTFIEYLQDLQRTVGRNWNIVPSDKLRIFENDSLETPTTIDRSDIVANSVQFVMADPRSVPAMRSLGFIDTGRDNDFNKVRAVRARFPIPLTAAEDSEELDIPIGMLASSAKYIVNRSLLIDDIARQRVSFTVLPHLRALQPGDIILPDFDPEVDFGAARIVSVARNSNWTSDIVAERLELTRLAVRPAITSNGAGATASITVDEEDGVSVTTVTATNADDADAFSIIGGVDAAFFEIDPDTGVLEFFTEPDFEDPEDADSNNVYEVIVQVTGDGLTDTQAISVTVADVSDGSEEAPEFLIIF